MYCATYLHICVYTCTFVPKTLNFLKCFFFGLKCKISPRSRSRLLSACQVTINCFKSVLSSSPYRCTTNANKLDIRKFKFITHSRFLNSKARLIIGFVYIGIPLKLSVYSFYLHPSLSKTHVITYTESTSGFK